MLFLLLGALYWWIWRYCARLAILTGTFLEYYKWPFLFLAPARVIPSIIERARLYSPRLTSESVFSLLWASLGSAVIVFGPTGEMLTWAEERFSLDLGQPQDAMIYAFIIQMLSLIPIFAFFTIRSRRVLSAAKSALEGYSGIKLLDVWRRLSPFGKWNEQAQFARWVRENKHMVFCEGNRRVLFDAIKAIERDHRQKLQFLGFKRPPIDPSWSPEFQAWYRKRAPRLFGLADWHGTPLNELQLLLEQVEAGLKAGAERQST